MNTEDTSWELFNTLNDIDGVDCQRPDGECLENINVSADKSHHNELDLLIQEFDWYISNRDGNELNLRPNVSSNILKDKTILDEYCYHATTEDNVESIIKNGLLASSKNSNDNYPNRIYFTTKESTLENLAGELARHHDKEMVILKFPTKKIKGNIYKDPDAAYNDSYYIQDQDINEVSKVKEELNESYFLNVNRYL